MRLVTIIILSLLTQISWTQCENGWLINSDFKRISNENRTNIAFSWGVVSYQGFEDNFYYLNSDEPQFYLGFGKAVWVSAIDAAGNLRVSGNTFPTINGSDFIAGPLDRDTGQPIDTSCLVYNRVWKVDGFNVFLHRMMFEQGSLVEEEIPIDILEWPAKGNPYLGEYAPDFDLAPFVDVAEDGIYNALDGDYPIALEESPEFIPEQFSYTVTNDVSFQQLTRGLPIGVELQQMNYVVNCTEESIAEKTVFTRIKYKYLGKEPLSNFKVALWEDSDLGCNINDYEGCDRDLNCIYFYNKNGETFRGDCGVDSDPPDDEGVLRTTVFFNKAMLAYRHWWLLGVGSPIVQGIDPSLDVEFDQYMNGVWRDGTPLTIGGNGYNPGSAEVTRFSYPDRPDDPNGWSMQTANLPDPLDVRALTNLVDKAIETGEEDFIDFGDMVIYAPEKKQLSVFEELTPRVNALKEDYQNMVAGNFSCAPAYEICYEDCVWPGDVNGDGGVTAKDFIFAGAMAGLNADGIPRAFESSDWFGFNGDDWQIEINGRDLKYGDVNGNGIINVRDLDRIGDNLGLERSWFYDPDVLLEVQSDFGLRIFKSKDSIDIQDAQIFERLFQVNAFLEDIGDLRTPLHGVSFEIHFDTNMVMPFVKIDDNFSQVFEYGNIGMANAVRDGNQLRGNNEIECGFTNYTDQVVTTGGLLLEQNFYVKDGAATPNPDGRDTLVMKFYDVCAIDGEGNLAELGAKLDTLILINLEVDTDVMTSSEEIHVADDFQVYPNPTKGMTQVHFNHLVTGTLTIMDLSGRVLFKDKLNKANQIEADLSALPSGMFIMAFDSEDGKQLTKKIVIER